MSPNIETFQKSFQRTFPGNVTKHLQTHDFAFSEMCWKHIVNATHIRLYEEPN